MPTFDALQAEHYDPRMQCVQKDKQATPQCVKPDQTCEGMGSGGMG